MAPMRRGYLLFMLTLILAFNYVDRFAMGIVLEDIKADLALTDTELGVLTGIAFALFYSVMGIPLARWADRGDRIRILTVTATLWSGAVALCAAAAGFVQLLLARIGVAVGEAGCYGPALSLISDHYGRAERPRAVARFMLGIPLAMVIGYFAGGWLNELFGWRITFIAIGLPGLALAGLTWWTLRDPRSLRTERQSAELNVHEHSPATARGVLVALFRNGAYRHLLACFSIWGFFGYGVQQWQPAFFMRSYDVESGVLGTLLVLSVGLSGLAGTWFGGEIIAKLAGEDERRQLKIVALLYASGAITGSAVYVAPTLEVSMLALTVTSLLFSAGNGPLFAASQTLVAPHMRATSIAVMYFFCNFIGLGLGPLCVGAFSDVLSRTVGGESLRYALLAFSPGYFWCAWHLWRAAQEACVRDTLDDPSRAPLDYT